MNFSKFSHYVWWSALVLVLTDLLVTGRANWLIINVLILGLVVDIYTYIRREQINQ